MLIGTGYTLEEVGTPDRYIVPDDQTAAIEWNKVTNKSFDNDLKRGDLKVTKTAEDGLNDGYKRDSRRDFKRTSAAVFYIPEVMKNMIAKRRNMKFRERKGQYGQKQNPAACRLRYQRML